MFHQNGTSLKYCWRFRNKNKDFCKHHCENGGTYRNLYFYSYERAIINICDLLIIYFKPIFLFYLY